MLTSGPLVLSDHDLPFFRIVLFYDVFGGLELLDVVVVVLEPLSQVPEKLFILAPVLAPDFSLLCKAVEQIHLEELGLAFLWR